MDKENVEEVKAKLDQSFYLDDGVSKWEVVYPIAKDGKRQSPIDICPGEVRPDPTLKPLRMNYGKDCCVSIINNGNSWKVSVNDKLTSLSGGGLKDEYKLIQFHAHWGTTGGAKGSEHTVNGKLYPGEIHFVHWNTKYGSFNEAVNHSDGISVVGAFLDIGEKDHSEYGKLLKNFDKIRFKGQKVDLSEPIDPTKLMPTDMSYWHYPGSLTTPPLNECVLWHVLRCPVFVSREQLKIMASLKIGTEKNCHCIVSNFRPPLPLGEEREVRLFDGELHHVPETPVLTDIKKEIHGVSKKMEEYTHEHATLISAISELRDVVTNLKQELSLNKKAAIGHAA